METSIIRTQSSSISRVLRNDPNRTKKNRRYELWNKPDGLARPNVTLSELSGVITMYNWNRLVLIIDP